MLGLSVGYLGSRRGVRGGGVHCGTAGCLVVLVGVVRKMRQPGGVGEGRARTRGDGRQEKRAGGEEKGGDGERWIVVAGGGSDGGGRVVGVGFVGCVGEEVVGSARRTRWEEM